MEKDKYEGKLDSKFDRLAYNDDFWLAMDLILKSWLPK